MSDESSKEINQEISDLEAPKYWTTLYHGSNLGRKEWEGKIQTLDQPTLKLTQGLSTITQQDKDYSGKIGYYGTTKTYQIPTRGTTNQPLEIRILFPDFHSRSKLSDEAIPYYGNKYGNEEAKRIKELSDSVHWRNMQKGRHPLLPKNMELTKLQDNNLNGIRIVQYVPTDLLKIYKQEINLE
ncbi:MAG TPA: hypothetical protein VG895_03300 [Patescibacteria group bacterium]|nr:hypothetical protein [Patescibacteria group bacterium]